MRRFAALGLIVALAALEPATAARADGGEAARAVAQRVAAEMVEAGYTDVEVGWTWLGRLRVTGRIDGRDREIILHPTSGEVLRDFLAPPEVAAAPWESDDDDSHHTSPRAVGVISRLPAEGPKTRLPEGGNVAIGVPVEAGSGMIEVPSDGIDAAAAAASVGGN